MALVPLTAELEASTSLIDLAGRLGRVCLADERHLTSLYAGDETRAQRLYMEGLVEAIDPVEWQPGPQRGFAHILEKQNLAVTAKHLSQYHPLEYLAFVRGLLKRPLTDFFEQTEERILLSYGLPVPFATRPLNASFESATPFQPTLTSRGLLDGLHCEFFRHATTDSIRVTLDFRHRDRLDEITWSATSRLPCVATLHPSLGDGQLDFTQSGATFFDVRPKCWSRDEVLAWLRSVRHHQIAILPELCLPSPDALAPDLAAAPSEYPPLIVAGSAHVQRAGAAGTIRSNESHVYLDGQLVNVHRKIHPLQTRKLGARLFKERISEGITREPKDLVVLSGKHTRLGVVICADLNDILIPALLEAAGVNLLIVPALTYSAGAFNGAVCGLASRCQAVCVIVNASLDGATSPGGHKDPPPFLVLASVPRPEPEEQSRSYPHPSKLALPRGIFDPNRQLHGAMEWT
jgi:Carbon-nitrogen hydrolase